MTSAVPPEQPTGRALWAAIGGGRGIVEAVLPELAFLVLFATTKSTLWSVVVPLAIGIVFLVVRLAQRQSAMPAIGGVVLLAVSAVGALVTGNANANFVPGFVINAVCLVLLLVSLATRWPLVGLLVGAIVGKAAAAHEDARFRGGATAASWVFVGVFAIRLLVELPLYFADATEALAVARLLTGIPLYALAIWFGWMLLRGRMPAEADASGE